MTIDPNAIDRAILTFSTSSTIEYDVSGDNYLRLIGTIENYDSLVAEYGQFTGFEIIRFQVQDNPDIFAGNGQLYISYNESNLNDVDAANNTFDISNLSPGIYYVQIIDKEYTYIRSLIVQ